MSLPNYLQTLLQEETAQCRQGGASLSAILVCHWIHPNLWALRQFQSCVLGTSGGGFFHVYAGSSAGGCAQRVRDEVGGQHRVSGLPAAALRLAVPCGTSMEGVPGWQNSLPRGSLEPSKGLKRHMGVHLWCKRSRRRKRKTKKSERRGELV